MCDDVGVHLRMLRTARLLDELADEMDRAGVSLADHPALHDAAKRTSAALRDLETTITRV